MNSHKRQIAKRRGLTRIARRKERNRLAITLENCEVESLSIESAEHIEWRNCVIRFANEKAMADFYARLKRQKDILDAEFIEDN